MVSTQFKTENYMARSFIIVEGKKNSNNFYIIRGGKVKLMKENPVLSDDSSHILGPGDFFGVISCMSTRPRIETAIALENVSLISVERDQFGILIQKNPVVAMKIIRFFSKQLREFNQAITKLTLKESASEDPEHLYKIGEYYFKNQVKNHSVYAFQKYIQHCPNGPNIENAMKRLKSMNAPMKAPQAPPAQMNKIFSDNTMIFCENEPGYEMYVIQAGKVKITKITVDEEVLLAVLSPGDIFGEMSLLENKPRSASAISYGDVKLLAINQANFEGMVHAQPQLAIKIIQLLSERIWTAYRQLENLMIKDPLARIYDTLLLQLEKQKVNINSHDSHNFEFGTKELLNMVGLPPSKGERYMVELLNDKYFTLESGKIICKNLEELEKSVHFFKKRALMEKKREESKII